jgi:hypothetical protein
LWTIVNECKLLFKNVNLCLSAKSIVIVYFKPDKLRLAFVKYSLQSLNIVLQMKTIVNGSLTIVYNS